ncbi:50S ribosomal protein L15 [bacterium]|nr:50S ribosomal protein L15 [bacterium]
MQLHQIQPKNKLKKKKRVGRGGKRGTYSGRGVKGQKARAGHKLQPIIREIIKKYPKLRGYNFNPLQKRPLEIVNLSQIEVKFKEGEVVTPESLIEKKLIKKIKGRIPQVKILGDGEITKKIIIRQCLISKSAKEKVEKAGGKVEIS